GMASWLAWPGGNAPTRPAAPQGGPMPSDDSGSVTQGLGALRGGDLDAVQPLWERDFARPVRLAQARLRTRPGVGAAQHDEEEAASLGASDPFGRATPQGRSPRLDDRDARWRLLAAITERKATNQMRRARRLKRGGGRVRTGADLTAGGSANEPAGVDGIAGP